MGDTISLKLKRVVMMSLIACSAMVIGCSSNNTNAGGAVVDTANSGMGADTTSAKTDSLRDSLNR